MRQAVQRLEDARQFLDAARLADAADVIATCAIHAVIAAVDVITCRRLGQRSNDGNHGAAVALLRLVDVDLANMMKRALDLKTKAAYESDDVSQNDAVRCVRWAEHLLSAAEVSMDR